MAMDCHFSQGVKASGLGNSQGAYNPPTDMTSMQRQGQAPTMAPSLGSKSSDALSLSSQGLPKTGKNQLAPKNVSGKLTYEQQLSGYSAQANSMQAGSYGQGRPLEACFINCTA
jgi:hypothetical protein